MEALTASGGGEPATYALWLFDLVEVFYEAQPCHLLQLGDVGSAQPVASAGCCDHPAKTANELLSCLPATLASKLHEGGNGSFLYRALGAKRRLGVPFR